MNDGYFEEIISTLNSHTRRQVLQLLLENPQGLRFSEIARALNIYPSTLEKHLALLVTNKMISHHDVSYFSTVNSILIWDKLEDLKKLDSHPYLSSHIFPLDNQNLRNRFGSLYFEIIPDLISIINQIKNDFSEPQTLVQAGGNLDYQIGKSVYRSGLLNHKNTRVEIILTKQLIDKIRSQQEEDLFLSGFDDKTTCLYEIEECSMGLGVGKYSGFLFLPQLDFKVDYNQCLYTKSTDALEWLREIFNHLRAKSQIFTP
ncbi:MAG: ArsR family transcriptional regulator [Candidatus Thorarchaeota archaeon]